MLEALMVRRSLRSMLRDESAEVYREFDRICRARDSALVYTLPDMEAGYRFLLESQTTPLPAIDRNDLSAIQLATELKQRGMQTIVIDVTTKDVRSLGLCVVRVLVPGMQPLDVWYRARHLGGRRLVQVPQKMGWPTAPTWNPYPQPLG